MDYPSKKGEQAPPPEYSQQPQQSPQPYLEMTLQQQQQQFPAQQQGYPQNSDQYPQQYQQQSQQYQQQPQQYQQQPQQYQQQLQPGSFFPNPDLHPPLLSIWDNCPLDMNPAPNLIDNLRYPKSSKVYQEMCLKFGQKNVFPAPAWLTDADDESRLFWYKSGSNSLLYFLLNYENKYRLKFQAIIDEGLCGCCSYDDHVEKQLSSGGTSAMTIFGCNCFLRCWPGASWVCCDIAGPDHMRYANPDAEDCCYCPTLCCGWLCGQTKSRKNFIHRLQKGGIDIDNDCCCCTHSLCCTPCTSSQQQAVYLYYMAKRWGYIIGGSASMPKKMIANESQANFAKWRQYFLFVNQSEHHPYFDQASPDSLQNPEEPLANEISTIKEWHENFSVKYHPWRPLAPAFIENSNPEKAIQIHNTRWKNVHSITGLTFSKENRKIVQPVTM